MIVHRNPGRAVRCFFLGAALLLALLPVSSFGQSAREQGYVSQGLVGMGRLSADLRDKFGETTVSQSALAIDPASWRRSADGYQGTFYLLPDRGWNVTGTLDYRPRVHKVAVAFKPSGQGAPGRVDTTLADTIMLTDAAGEPLTGLDPTGVRAAANGFPDLPQASNGRISLDPEAIVLLPDGGFFISDEYGPYIYRFSPAGRMLGAIRPPEAFIPIRNGKQDFSSNNPGPGAKAPEPADPEFGRQNNQGFEGLSLLPDGRTLAVILQSATRQDGGNAASTREHTRILFYDVSDLNRPRLVREHVVVLPTYQDEQGRRRVAAQSELLALDANRFLLLSRDTGSGYGMKSATSRYRSVDLLDTSRATDIAGTPYDGKTPVAPGGKLAAGIVPATLVPFLDINDNAELAKAGLHNGAPNDRNNLSEKWEAMGLVPALDPAHPRDVFLFVGNDNDFMTQNGFQVGAPYGDPSGVDVDSILLAYRLTLPEEKK